jgi:hypothetical protein
MKALLKRTDRDKYRTLPNKGEIIDRDYILVTTVCNHPKTREHIRDLEIAAEVTIDKFGRQRSGFRIVEVALPLSKLLWTGYQRESELEPFVAWTHEIGIARPDIGDGYYLTADALKAAVSGDRAPPLEIASVEFARYFCSGHCFRQTKHCNCSQLHPSWAADRCRLCLMLHPTQNPQLSRGQGSRQRWK